MCKLIHRLIPDKRVENKIVETFIENEINQAEIKMGADVFVCKDWVTYLPDLTNVDFSIKLLRKMDDVGLLKLAANLKQVDAAAAKEKSI